MLDAALELMSRKGYAEATIGEIAKEAGVSKGLAYYHFKSKSEIAQEILGNGLETLIGRFEVVAAAAGSASQALNEMLDAFSELVVSNWRFARFYLSVLWRDGLVWEDSMRDAEDRLIRVIAGQFERGVAEGSVRADVDCEFAAVSSIGLVLTTAMRYFGMGPDSEPALSTEQFTSSVRAFVVNAVAARPAQT